jgi:hypothetical protein
VRAALAVRMRMRSQPCHGWLWWPGRVRRVSAHLQPPPPSHAPRASLLHTVHARPRPRPARAPCCAAQRPGAQARLDAAQQRRRRARGPARARRTDAARDRVLRLPPPGAPVRVAPPRAPAWCAYCR